MNKRKQRIHPFSPRHLFLRTGHRTEYRCALAVAAIFVLCACIVPAAGAVVPYRSPDDYGPSLQAREHRDDCRQRVLQALDGKIESEDFVTRTDREYFRYVVRRELREVMFICDARSGEIRRQIDLWGDL
ncbi:hypothetical protein Herbaro_17635 [Herbaspirillum sp. WKF16]|jgi:hypothetical protein|uniref:hypothetical protein n=1 Tax=Herbaspirillum sp. WKF16 TaxID=3028312 RepID=UPI0023A9998C|nr:hypothetical protein [Herbaspirillum sp. WKF16]WDZ95293.1 hypothetical protein Herbaro_17635 [Herbaspirillum sp. WKF16]